MLQKVFKIIVLFILSVGIIYLKIGVVSHEKELLSLNKQIRLMGEDMEVLEAELTYLARPERIRQIAAESLNLQFPRSNQVSKLEIDLGQ